MNRTPQQEAFVQEMVNGDGHIALMARAGSGKTTTILQGIKAVVDARPRSEILFTAFNKRNADEGAAKLKKMGLTDWKQVQAATAHSLGFGLLRFAFPGLKVDDKKVMHLVDARNDDIYQRYGSQIVSLVKAAKVAGFGFFPDAQIGDAGAWYRLADDRDINGLDDTSEGDDVIAAAQHIYRASLNETSIIDYDDMILFPLVKNLRVRFQKDIVIVDEAQDLSPARQALVRKFVKRDGGRLVIVGDDRQAIYLFSGADAQAMQGLIDSMGMKVMPLSVSFRCPKAVINLARGIVPDIEASADAIEGNVIYQAEITAVPGDAILCRNVAPLIKCAYGLIRKGIPAKVLGRSIGEGLIKLARRWKVSTIAALLNKLDDYRERELQKAAAKNNEAKMEEIEDRVGTLVEICAACQAKGQQSVTDVIAFIDALFASDESENGEKAGNDVVVLSSYHRSKGSEWKRVFLYEHDARCPARAARKPEQIVQEWNAAYVAITRAQETLVFVGG